MEKAQEPVNKAHSSALAAGADRLFGAAGLYDNRAVGFL